MGGGSACEGIEEGSRPARADRARTKRPGIRRAFTRKMKDSRHRG